MNLNPDFLFPYLFLSLRCNRAIAEAVYESLLPDQKKTMQIWNTRRRFYQEMRALATQFNFTATLEPMFINCANCANWPIWLSIPLNISTAKFPRLEFGFSFDDNTFVHFINFQNSKNLNVYEANFFADCRKAIKAAMFLKRLIAVCPIELDNGKFGHKREPERFEPAMFGFFTPGNGYWSWNWHTRNFVNLNDDPKELVINNVKFDLYRPLPEQTWRIDIIFGSFVDETCYAQVVLHSLVPNQADQVAQRLSLYSLEDCVKAEQDIVSQTRKFPSQFPHNRLYYT